MKLKIFKYKKVKSTNDIAIRKIRSGIKNGIVTSDLQSSGRGRHGNKWVSYKGNLFVTIFFSISNNLNLNKFNYKNCLIIKKVLSRYIKHDLKIKKPNDILFKQYKICGILQETIFYKNFKYLLVGVGLNLLKSPKLKNYKTTRNRRRRRRREKTYRRKKTLFGKLRSLWQCRQNRFENFNLWYWNCCYYCSYFKFYRYVN